MGRIKIVTPLNMNIEYETAGLLLRSAAFLIDMIFLMIFAIGSALGFDKLKPLYEGGAGENYIYYGALIAVFLVVSLYHIFCEYLFNGQSPGKKITGIAVVKLDGSKLDFQSCVLRWVFRIIDIQISFGGIAILSILWTESSQRIGDIAAGTGVVRIKSKLKFENTIGEILGNTYEIRFNEVKYLDDNAVTLVKDVLDFSMKTGNVKKSEEMIRRTAGKVIDIMSAKSHDAVERGNMTDTEFLKCILKDYNKFFEKF
ncbi:MAG: RDD family protein [Spirochaetes bacterium]|nr:RDD family protein [Spirochaetota bacterium]